MRLPVRVALLFAVAVIATVSVYGPGVPRVRGIENESFGLTPYPEDVNGAGRGTFQIPLEPGATFEDAVRIYNRTDQKLDLAVYAADGEAGPDDTDVTDISVGFRSDDPKGVGAWIDLARETVELPARDEVIVTFRVKVESAEPNPPYGAVVVENTARGVSGSAAQRAFLTVRTVPPNTETASERIRPLLLRSPWIVVAVLGLVVAAALVVIGARRARRPKDVLVPAGEIEQPELEPLEDVPHSSRPVIKRLGASDEEDTRTDVIVRRRGSNGPPLVDDAFLVEVDPDEEEYDEDVLVDEDLDEDDGYDVDTDDEDIEDDEPADDEDEDDLPPARPRPAARKPAARKATVKTPAARKPAARKPAPKKEPAKRTAAKKEPAARKKPAARKPAARRSAPKAKKEPRGFIPLEEL